MGLTTWRCMFLTLWYLGLSSGAFGQSVYGTIRGTLTIAPGAPLPQAMVLASALDKGDQVSLSAQTDASGYYIISSVPPGVS